MTETCDETSTILRLLLAEQFPTLTGVVVRRGKRYTPDWQSIDEPWFVLTEAMFEERIIGVNTWFNLDDLEALTRDLAAKLRRRTKRDEDAVAGIVRPTKKYCVLAFIASRGEGVRASEIAEFIVSKLIGLDWDQKNPYGRRRYRGWWGTHLYGPRGMLREFCVKGKDGRWRIDARVDEESVVANRATILWKRGPLPFPDKPYGPGNTYPQIEVAVIPTAKRWWGVKKEEM